nr:MAG: hypothetical protein [Podoviridae sp. ctka020]
MRTFKFSDLTAQLQDILSVSLRVLTLRKSF